MRLSIWMLLSCLLLFGCSVTIDEPTSPPDDMSIPEEPTPIAEEIPLEEVSSSFVGIIENIFQLEWSAKKMNDARVVHYLALGDSLTRGVGDEKITYGYSERLSNELEKWPAIVAVELDNRGKNGRRSDQLLTLLENGHYDEELAHADLITMTLGGNDVMKIVKGNLFSLKKSMFDKELVGFEKRYGQIIKEIRKRNADVPIILVGFYNPFSIVVDEVTPFEPIIREWNAIIERQAVTDGNACFVPVEDLFTSNEDMVYHVDFFHPNSVGYERMTKRIVESMKACGIEGMSSGLMGFEE